MKYNLLVVSLLIFLIGCIPEETTIPIVREDINIAGDYDMEFKDDYIALSSHTINRIIISAIENGLDNCNQDVSFLEVNINGGNADDSCMLDGFGVNIRGLGTFDQNQKKAFIDSRTTATGNEVAPNPAIIFYNDGIRIAAVRFGAMVDYVTFTLTKEEFYNNFTELKDWAIEQSFTFTEDEGYISSRRWYAHKWIFQK